MDKHISLARELGYEGQELRDYLKRQQDLEREERLAQREYEKEKREAEQKDKEREEKDKEREQKDKEREQKEKDREQKDKDRELEKLRIDFACSSMYQLQFSPYILWLGAHNQKTLQKGDYSSVSVLTPDKFKSIVRLSSKQGQTVSNL